MVRWCHQRTGDRVVVLLRDRADAGGGTRPCPFERFRNRLAALLGVARLAVPDNISGEKGRGGGTAIARWEYQFSV